MSNFFGGGFTAPPNSQCKLRQAQGPFQQQPVGPVQTGPIPTAFPQQHQQPFTQPMVHLGAAVPPYAPPAPPPQVHAAPRAVLLPVVQPTMQGPAQPPPQQEAEPARQYVQAPGPMGPRSFPVMKKGEAPCPICRG